MTPSAILAGQQAAARAVIQSDPIPSPEECDRQMRLLCGFDYENQAWVVDGRYVSCGHPETMDCGCFGRIHAGESPAANAEIH